MDPKVGDRVVKTGAYDDGVTGVVVEAFTNPVGHRFVKVLTDDGEVKTWVSHLVEPTSENEHPS